MRSSLSIAVAFDVGGGMTKVGRVVHVRQNVISVSVPFVILVVAVSPAAQLPPVEVILGGKAYPDHFLVIVVVIVPRASFENVAVA